MGIRIGIGGVGEIVYGEGNYYHDFDHELYDVFRWRGGADWKKIAGSPPMYYPTHSTSMIVGVTGARMTKNPEETVNLTELLSCVVVPGQRVDGPMSALPSSDDVHRDVSKIHPVERLPKEFEGLPNLHSGSHKFLVDDFVKACVSGAHPPNSVWQAARYIVPGLIAHESAKRGGMLMEVPDLGDPPS
jgi:hypothetical protein